MAAEPGAEDELVRRYSLGVSVLLGRAVGDRAAAEDLHQETLRIVIEKIRRGELVYPEKLSGFICNVARNLVVEYFRQESRIGKRAGDEATESLADPQPDPLSLLLREEKARIVRQVIGELNSPRDRELLFRFYVAEEDKQTICADLGLTSLHFNRVLHRARERYRELYEKRSTSGGINERQGTP